jgi:hypothetical protein
VPKVNITSPHAPAGVEADTAVDAALASLASVSKTKKKSSSPFGGKYEIKFDEPPDNEVENNMIADARKGFAFGCDPEIFIRNKETKKPISAFAANVPGSKAEPFKVPGGAVQRDGMAAEINIDPVTTYQGWETNITMVLTELTKIIGEENELFFAASCQFTQEDFDAVPDDDKILGCTPDMNAWTGDINPPPSPELIGNPFLRSAGGHAHISWTQDADLADAQHVMNCRDLVKQLDWYIAAWAQNSGLDTDTVRRSLYGKAGACRYKSYGVEYRTPSNFWVENKQRRLAFWNRMQQAIWDMTHYCIPEKSSAIYNQLIQAGLNNGKIDSGTVRDFRYPIRTLDQSYQRSLGRI